MVTGSAGKLSLRFGSSHEFNEFLISFSVLRPVRAVTQISKLKVVLLALVSAFPNILDTLIILVFFYAFFATAGLQIFSGYLQNRCVDHKFLSNGTLVKNISNFYCGNLDCPENIFTNYTCEKTNINPDFGITRFDAFSSSLLQIYRIVSLDDWTSIMYPVQKTFSNFASIFFISVVLIGSYILMNITLAIIKVKFSEMHASFVKLDEENSNNLGVQSFDIYLLKNLRVWKNTGNSDLIKKFHTNPTILGNLNNIFGKIINVAKTSIRRTFDGSLRKSLKFNPKAAIYKVKQKQKKSKENKFQYQESLNSKNLRVSKINFEKWISEALKSEFAFEDAQKLAKYNLKYLKAVPIPEKEYLSSSLLDVRGKFIKNNFRVESNLVLRRKNMKIMSHYNIPDELPYFYELNYFPSATKCIHNVKVPLLYSKRIDKSETRNSKLQNFKNSNNKSFQSSLATLDYKEEVKSVYRMKLSKLLDNERYKMMMKMINEEIINESTPLEDEFTIDGLYKLLIV